MIDLPNYLLHRRIIDAKTGCWLWTGAINDGGYGVARYRGKVMKVHRLAGIAWMGMGVSSKRNLNHTCKRKHCFNPEHLYFGTQKENAKDRYNSMQKGHKLTYDDVHMIRAFHADGVSMKSLAKQFGVSPAAIGNVIHRRTFTEVE